MDLQTIVSSLQGSSKFDGLPNYLIDKFFPVVLPLISRYPRLFRIAGTVLGMWWMVLGLGRLKSL